MASVDISFPDTESAEASALADELRLELARDGVDPAAMQLKRANPEAQDLGSILTLAMTLVGAAWPYVEGTAKAVEVYKTGKTIFEFCRRERRGVRISTARGSVTLKPDEVDLEKLVELLRRAIDDNPHKS
jgi:hypothetical protein